MNEAHLRALWGPLVGRLARAARLSDPSLAEDAVQAAMLQAVRTWPVAGAPVSPAAWLTTVARHHLIDALRVHGRDASLDAMAEDAPDRAAALAATDPEASGERRLDGEIDDDELALLFACCDPALPPPSQVAFALKTVCGFGLREIAAALFTNESALAQRLARARGELAARGRTIALPAGAELAPRRDGVLAAIYLLFNEGYAASGAGPAGDTQRPDLCREAIRLARALAAHRHSAHPDADALAALLLLHGARLPSRVDGAGDWLLLADQPRGRWKREMIAAGLVHLDRAGRAQRLSRWHLEAGIAAEHATAATFAATRWEVVRSMYDALLRIDPSPMIALSRAIAVAYAGDPGAALAAIDALLPEIPQRLAHFAHAARGDVLARLHRGGEAAAAFERAIALAHTDAERRLLAARRRALA